MAKSLGMYLAFMQASLSWSEPKDLDNIIQKLIVNPSWRCQRAVRVRLHILSLHVDKEGRNHVHICGISFCLSIHMDLNIIPNFSFLTIWQNGFRAFSTQQRQKNNIMPYRCHYRLIFPIRTEDNGKAVSPRSKLVESWRNEHILMG